jgi:hypothetical protein
LRNPHRLEKLLQKHLARMRRLSMGRYTYHFPPPNGSPQSAFIGLAKGLFGETPP